MQFRKRFIYMFISLALLILASCSKESENPELDAQAATIIRVTKNVMGADATFSFTITRPATTTFTITTSGGTGTKQYPATPNWDGGAAPTTGLYTVVENTPPTGYVMLPIICRGNNATPTTTADDRIMPPNGIYLKTNETVTCTITNASRGVIKVVKKSIGDSGTFSFTSTIPGAASFNLTTPALTTGSSSSVTQTYSNLVAGTYEVAETPVPAGWTLSSIVCKGDNATPATTTDDITYAPDELALDKGEIITCTFTNTKKSTLTIVKNTVGGDGDFTFTSTNLPGRPYTINTTEGTGQQVVTISTSPTYNLAETAQAGWTLSTTECKRNNATPANATDDAVIALNALKAKAGEAIVCTFNNTAVRDVTVTKLVTGASAPSGATFDVTVDCDGPEASTLEETATVGHEGTVTVANVPVNSVCTFSEADPGEDWSISTNPEDGEITVTPEGPNTGTITNTYGAMRVVTVTKAVESDVPASAPAQSFAVTLTCGAATDTQTIAADSSVSVTASVGETCTVSETDVADWDEGTVADFTVSATAGDNNKTLTNTYNAVRDVTLTKQVVANAFSAVDNAATFDITLNCGEGFTGNNAAASDDTVVTVTGVPVGTTCTASEVAPGADWTVAGDGGTVTVSAAGPNALEITNTYAAVRDVVVNKTLTSSVPASAPDGAFDVSLDCTGTSDDQSGSITTTEGSGSTTFTGVPVGQTCDVTEPDSTDWTEGSGSISVSAGDNTVNITNTYIAVRDVTVTKTLVDAEFAPATSFDISLTCSNDPFTGTLPTTGGDVTFEDVPVGAECTASDDAGADWDETPASVTVGTGTNTATVTNTYVAQGSITVVKNAIGGDGIFEFMGTPTIGDFDLETTGGTATSSAFAVNAGTYSVVETALSDWVQGTPSCSDESPNTAIEVSPGEDVTCTFTNTAKGTIVIVKNTLPTGQNSTFSFTGSLGGFSLTTVGNTKTRTFNDVVAGSYTVTESAKTGWTFTSLTCSDPDSGTTTSGTTATIDLDPGETITCTYVNTKN